MKVLRTVLLLLLALQFPRRSVAAGFGQPLTHDQVACEEGQLTRLAYRMTVAYHDSNLFLWRSSPGGGVYRGLAVSSQMQDPNTDRPIHKEDQLAFDLILKAEEDFLDPRRPRMPQATLVRRDVSSNVIPKPPPGVEILDVNLDLAPVVPNPGEPKLPLRIFNWLSAGAGQDDRAGQGIALDGLTTACHNEISDFDLKVFSILARTVRASDCLLQPVSGCFDRFTRFKEVIFRGEEPRTYRMNIDRYDIGCFDDGCVYGEGGVALLFHIQVDEQGQLQTGDVQVLPWCPGGGQLGCTNLLNPEFAVFILPPFRPGIDVQGPAIIRRAPHLNIDFIGSEFNVLQATIDWKALLTNTAWN